MLRQTGSASFQGGSREGRGSSLPAIATVPIDTPQKSLAAPSSDPTPPREHKRKHDLNENHPRKRSRIASPCRSQSSKPLSRENLKLHNTLTGSATTSAEMDSTVTSSPRKSQKRASSQRSSGSDQSQEAPSTRSGVSSGTAGKYRWVVLQCAEISVQSEPLPTDIKDRLDAILQRKVSEERRLYLCGLAQSIGRDFEAVFGGGRREDDSVEPLFVALHAMDNNGKFSFPRKSGEMLCS